MTKFQIKDISNMNVDSVNEKFTFKPHYYELYIDIMEAHGEKEADWFMYGIIKFGVTGELDETILGNWKIKGAYNYICKDIKQHKEYLKTFKN